VQASVHGFDEQTGFGSVLLDDGVERGFDGDVFFASGLRHLRVGQRVSVDLAGDAVTRLWIVGIGDGEPIR
jgi:cold shock CspA family protein